MIVTEPDAAPAIPPVNEETIRDSEERAFRAWPADSVTRMSGWAIRQAIGSSTRRTNSVFAGSVDGAINLDALLGQVESFYKNLSLPPRFQITPVSAPHDLDGRLEGRGYSLEGQSSVVWALNSDVVQKSGGPIDDVFFSSSLTDDWAELYVQSIQQIDDPKARLALFDRIKGEKAHVTVIRENVPVAIGLGIYDSGWTGVFTMFTLPGYRRQGIARGIMDALAEWTDVVGGKYMYLQVEADNHAALSVYEQCGFHPAYQYHYRTLSE